MIKLGSLVMSVKLSIEQADFDLTGIADRSSFMLLSSASWAVLPTKSVHQITSYTKNYIAYTTWLPPTKGGNAIACTI